MPRTLRVVGSAVGLVLLCLHLVICTGAVAAVALSVAPSAALAGMVAPDSFFYRITVPAMSLALLATGLRYVYYYYCWFRTRRDFSDQGHVSMAGLRLQERPFMKFQITTKGGAYPVVERSLWELDAFCRAHPRLSKQISAEVITEVEDEVRMLEDQFGESALRVLAILLPADYATPNGTGLKARALHYMVEKRRAGFNAKSGKTFIVHMDEETLITERELLVLLDYLSHDPRPISQGPIFYPMDWRSTPWMCRTLECIRPFGCSECANVMRNPPPAHLHGSNLVVEETAENQIGWDFGCIDGEPFVAEDLLFGLRAYAVLGEHAFGWHGAVMLEQPALSAYWAFRQRKRWVQGALQALRAVWVRPEFADMPRPAKLRLHARIAYRVGTYALGFPIGMTGIAFFLQNLTAPSTDRWLATLSNPLESFLIVGAAAWLVSYQIGLARNLRFQCLPWHEMARQSLIVLALTPLAGLLETVGPFIAVTESMFGISKANWVPTPKLSKMTQPAFAQTA